MKKFMQKVLGTALAVLVLAGVLVQPVLSTEAAYPRDPQGGVFSSTEFIGVRQYLLRETATVTTIVSNDQGLLYGICRMGTTLGDYTVAFDYYSADVSNAVFLSGSAYDKYLMTPYVYVDEEHTATYAQAESVRGCWWPPHPVRFESGLIGRNGTAGGYSLFFYRTDAGGNPY